MGYDSKFMLSYSTFLCVLLSIHFWSNHYWHEADGTQIAKKKSHGKMLRKGLSPLSEMRSRSTASASGTIDDDGTRTTALTGSH